MRYDEIPKLNSEQFRKEVTEMVEQELSRTLENVEQTVSEEVTRLIPKIIPALLGLTHRWGEWEIQRTNGIDREHPLGVAYRQAAQDAASAAVTEAIKDWEPGKKMLAAIRKEYTEQMEYIARDAATRQAAHDAQGWAETFVNDVLDGKFDTPGAPEAKDAVLREIAEGKLKGAKAIAAATAVLEKKEGAE